MKSPKPLKISLTSKRKLFSSSSLFYISIVCIIVLILSFLFGMMTSFPYLNMIENWSTIFQGSSSSSSSSSDFLTGNETIDQDLKIVEISSHFIPSLRKLNAALLPVYYSDRLYREVLDYSRFCKMILLKNIPIGSITCRIEDPSSLYSEEPIHLFDESLPLCPREMHLYCMTLGVLAPYRRLGLGSILIKSLEKEASIYNEEYISNNSVPMEKKMVITAMTLHVQENNTVGMNFYESQGFSTVKFIKHYYTRITPRGAYLLIKNLPFPEQYKKYDSHLSFPNMSIPST